MFKGDMNSHELKTFPVKTQCQKNSTFDNVVVGGGGE